MSVPASPRCVVCHRERPAWGVCQGCLTCVDRMLGDLLDLHALASAPAALEPGRGSDPGPIGAHRDPPLPLDLAALDLALGEVQLGVLESWERWWREAFSLSPYGPASAGYASRTREDRRYAPSAPGLGSTATSRTLAGVVGFLRAWWPRAASVVEPPPEEFAQEVRHLHTQAKAALRLHEPAPWTVPCPADHPDHPAQECGYRLHIDHDGRELVMRCPRCRSVWTVDRLLLVAAAAGRGVWVDADTAAARLGTTPRGLAPMVRAGRLQHRYGRYNLATVTLRHAHADGA